MNLEAGNDVATLQSGASGKIDGGSDVDTLNTQASFNNLVGGNNGEVDGVNYTNFEEINMGDGADKASVNQTVNQLNLEAGNDVATQSGASGKIDGGSDVDTLNTRASYGSNLVGGNNGEVDGVNYTSFEEINMGDGADKASVNQTVNQLNLEAGHDIATLQSGASGKIDGGSDVDTLNTRASYGAILLAAITVKLMVSTTQL